MWIIKNQKLKAKVNQFFPDKKIHSACCNQMDNSDEHILLSIDKAGIEMCLHKKYFEEEIEYKPGEWNFYPRIKPPRPGLYFVYLNAIYNPRLSVAYYDRQDKAWTLFPDYAIVAFKECHEKGPGGIICG